MYETLHCYPSRVGPLPPFPSSTWVQIATTEQGLHAAAATSAVAHPPTGAARGAPPAGAHLPATQPPRAADLPPAGATRVALAAGARPSGAPLPGARPLGATLPGTTYAGAFSSVAQGPTAPSTVADGALAVRNTDTG